MFGSHLQNGCQRCCLEKGSALLKAPGFQCALSAAAEDVFHPSDFLHECAGSAGHIIRPISHYYLSKESSTIPTENVDMVVVTMMCEVWLFSLKRFFFASQL